MKKQRYPSPAADRLVAVLHDWFSKPLEALPEALQKRVNREYKRRWDSLSPEERRREALDLDALPFADWLDETAYPAADCEDWLLWAWEFLRRNAEYSMTGSMS